MCHLLARVRTELVGARRKYIYTTTLVFPRPRQGGTLKPSKKRRRKMLPGVFISYRILPPAGLFLIRTWGGVWCFLISSLTLEQSNYLFSSLLFMSEWFCPPIMYRTCSSPTKIEHYRSNLSSITLNQQISRFPFLAAPAYASLPWQTLV